MSERSIAVDEARKALRLAKEKFEPHPKAVEAAKNIKPYVPPGPDCKCAPGVPPSVCSAYRENADWLPPAFVQNATCACETTPDVASANAVRLTLQKELAATPEAFKQECRQALEDWGKHPLHVLKYEAWVAERFAPVAYEWHKRAYASGCCPCGPAPFVDWVAVCTIEIPFCKLVEEAIDWFGSCGCTPGEWDGRSDEETNDSTTEDSAMSDSPGDYQLVGGWQLMQWPPFDIEKVSYYNYIVDADIGALQRLCDQFFSIPSGGEVVIKPLVPQVMFSFANIEQATSSDPRAGSTPEKDILLWTPVVQLNPDGTRVIRTPMFSPYVFVNNGTAVQLGREMFGFPKDWCALKSQPTDPLSQDAIDVWAYALKDGLPPSKQVLIPRQILKLDCTGGSGVPRIIEDFEEIIDELITILRDFITDENGLGIVLNAQAVALLGASLLGKKQDFAFLKQFPTMTREEAGKACYQTIGIMETTLGAIERLMILPYDYELTFVDDMFHSFSKAFGWTPGQALPVRAAFYMDFSFTIEDGKVIWPS